MKRDAEDASSLDMLLDTMCNTFGGICFIALMVSLISAALPKAASDRARAEAVAGQVAVKEIAGLERKRDELKAAVTIQEDFVRSAATGVVMKADVKRMVEQVAADDGQIRLYEKRRVEYLDALAKLKTKTAYSRREAARLARLLKELEDKVGRPLSDRHRAVRAPREHEVQGLSVIDVWLHEHRIYFLEDKRQVKMIDVPATGAQEKAWDYKLIEGRGVLLDDDFFRRGSQWRDLQKCLGPSTFVRIFADTVSFDELCLFRDALVSRKAMYNWHVCEERVLRFHKGYDGRVQ